MSTWPPAAAPDITGAGQGAHRVLIVDQQVGPAGNAESFDCGVLYIPRARFAVWDARRRPPSGPPSGVGPVAIPIFTLMPVWGAWAHPFNICQRNNIVYYLKTGPLAQRPG